MKKKILLFLFLAVIAAGLAWWFFFRKPSSDAQKAVHYRLATLTRATIIQEVSATGSIKPITTVDVGTQVTGKILKLHADYNSQVKKGQVLANVDPATYQASYDASCAQIASAEAQLKSAKASLESAEAALILNQTRLKYAERTHNRNLDLRKRLPTTGISDADLDDSASNVEQYQAQIASNKADITRAHASIAQAQAAIMQAEASGRQAKANLSYCTIVAPMDGIVLSREVDEGQTVVSNMNSSTLFTLADDLTKIQVEAAIPEADIGQVRVGQKVNFTVDAYRQTFTGVVKEIRLDAKTESNVITYPVIVEASNPKKELFPGMTANLSIIVKERTNVLAAPVAAIRFKGPTNAAATQKGPKLWLADSPEAIHAVEVRFGATDGVYTEIVGHDELENQSVATGVLTANELKNGPKTENPFAFKPPRRR